jgi:hypothetical protein
VDVDGMVNGWNIKIADLTGLPVGDAIGKHLLTLVEDSSTDIVKKMLNLALQGMSVFFLFHHLIILTEIPLFSLVFITLFLIM